MRRSGKLPFASAGGEPEVTIGADNWRLIEDAYGHALQAEVREAIVAATRDFLYFEVFERTAEPSVDAETIIVSLKKGAGAFKRTLLARAFGRPTDARVYATHLIKRHFHDPRLSDNDRLFDTLSGLLTSFDVACTNAVRQLNDPATPSHKEGDMWVHWIGSLAQAVHKVGLPCTVRKDAGNKSRSDMQSPFVRLVREVQECLPVECRRHHKQSESALADAVSRALRTVKSARESGAKDPHA